MRIVGGQFGGRRFSPPSSIPARPTTEVAKEGLFNTLNNMIDLDDVRTLDLFAGTGSISYELASRGAAAMTLVERDLTTIGFIKQTVRALGIEDQCTVIRNDIFKFIKNCTEEYDFIFAGPPYALQNIDDIPLLVFTHNMLSKGGIFVMEHTPRNNYELDPHFIRMKNYGTTVFSFFTIN